ncbi:hypothetical protein T492DRAFT_509366 [Pavlovales sp. CCMP2436]|nr:hypothetical protein T492DRAFT_509366 [Pavlovales sp. CCMP2436]
MKPSSHKQGLPLTTPVLHLPDRHCRARLRTGRPSARHGQSLPLHLRRAQLKQTRGGVAHRFRCPLRCCTDRPSDLLGPCAPPRYLLGRQACTCGSGHAWLLQLQKSLARRAPVSAPVVSLGIPPRWSLLRLPRPAVPPLDRRHLRKFDRALGEGFSLPLPYELVHAHRMGLPHIRSHPHARSAANRLTYSGDPARLSGMSHGHWREIHGTH